MFDAAIGCWIGKLTYWFIRSSQVAPGSKLIPLVGLPNHPSYPSGHSCASSAAAEVVLKFFPEQHARLDPMVAEAGLARLDAGIPPRFGLVAEAALGRPPALFPVQPDASAHTR